MKPLLSTGVMVMAVAGVSAYAVTAAVSETNLRMGTVARNPVDAIEKSLTILKTDRRTIEGMLALANTWQSGSNNAPAHPSEETSDSVSWPVALLQANDENPAKAANLAHKAAKQSPNPVSDPGLRAD